MTPISKKDTRWAKIGEALLELLPKGVGAFLLVKISDDGTLKTLWRNPDGDEQGTGDDAKRLQGICCKRQRPVLVHDAEKDIQMRGIRVRSFHSALCVPIFNEDKALLGVIFAASSETDTFTNDHRYALERFAREYGPALSALREVPTSDREEKTGRFDFLFTPLVLGTVVFALALFGLWSFAPSAKKPQPTSTMTPQAIKNEPLEVANLFLGELRERNYDSAWARLDSKLKSDWSPARFASQFSTWTDVGDGAKILESRRVSRAQRHNREAQVVLLESTVSGDRGTWVWNLREKDGRWSLTSLDGPVKSP